MFIRIIVIVIVPTISDDLDHLKKNRNVGMAQAEGRRLPGYWTDVN